MTIDPQLHFGEFEFDCRQRLLLSRGEVVPLAPKVLQTLELLLAARGGLVTKDAFMRALWPDTFVEESNLTQNIFVLRKTLGLTEAGEPYLKTVPKRGYRLTALVVDVHPAIPPAVLPATPDQETAEPVELAPDQSQVSGVAGEATQALADLQVAPVGARRWLPFAGFAAACSLLTVLAVVGWLRARSGAPLQIVDVKRLTNDGMPKTLGPFPSALVRDGQRIYFTERRNNRSLLASVDRRGGEVLSYPAPTPDAAVVDYAPQRHELLVGSIWHTDDRHPLLVRRDSDASVRQIGELTGHDASWSPSGDRLVFAHGRFLRLANADGSNVRSLVTAGGVVFWPRWSPDGQVIRFTVNFTSNRSEIWEVGVNGQNLRQVLKGTAEGEEACCGTWSADGQSYFYLVSGPATSNIWVVPYQTLPALFRAPQPVRLTVGTEDVWHAPLPSEDGHHLWAIAAHQRGELMSVDPATQALRPYLSGISAEGVTFSPDGQWIAYTAYPEGTLWKSHPDGTGRLQLTASPVVARFPRWSPDGNTIAFLAGEAGSDWWLYLLSVPSGTIQRLVEDGASQGVASWSPDGHTIAFGHLLDFGTSGNPNLTIEMYDLRTRRRSTVHGSSGLWTPRWSPDGRYIAAVTEDNSSLRLFDIATQQWSELADLGVNDLTWSPDSAYVYFDTAFGEEPMLYRIRVVDRKLEAWADLKELHRGGFFSPWLGMTPEGAPMLLRDTAIEEVYELSLGPPR